MSGLFLLDPVVDGMGVAWSVGHEMDANPLLAEQHYLGPLSSGGYELIFIGTLDDETVAAQVWRGPTSRHLPMDGTWLELSRWCLTPAAGRNAGSRMHRHAVAVIRRLLPNVTTLVSYSDPSHGHTGALYRACNWQWRPTWLRLRTPPTGNGAWAEGDQQEVKDRWVFPLRPDPRRDDALEVTDMAAARFWALSAPSTERAWASKHPQLSPLLQELGAHA